MKILILSQSRSGSTSLTDFIIKSTNLEYLHEPFNHGDFNKQLDKIKNSDNLIVKIVDNHFYKIDEFQDYKNLIKYFDKVIGLTRGDDYANARSRWIAEHFNSWDFASKDIDFDERDLDQQRLKDLIFESKHVRESIEQFDIFQVTFEGLFIDNTEWPALEAYLDFPRKI